MSETVTLESLDRRMDRSEQRLDRMETDVATLKTDVATLKTDVATLKTQMVEVTVSIHHLQTDMTEVIEQLRDFNLQQKSMTSAVMEALTQLNLSRTYEKRLDRLESAVFGKND